MSTAVEAPEKKKRGGPRGDRPWRDKPTARERVMTQSLSEFIKEVTGRDVSPDTVRAVRFALPKWSSSDNTKSLRDNIDKKLAKARLQDKREKALAQLKEAEAELASMDSEGDLDDEDEDDEDVDAEDYEDDDNEDESDDEDDDVFGDEEKVSASFG